MTEELSRFARIKSLLQDTQRIDSHTISLVVAECDMALTAAQPAQAAQVPDIDYQALIQAAWGTHKYAQGTRGCIAFKHGAEWFRGLLTAAQQGATND